MHMQVLPTRPSIHRLSSSLCSAIFFEMFVDDYTLMLDPTAGSGASLRAAESLKAKQVLGLEIDQQYLGPARKALSDERKKRAAAAIAPVNFGL